MVAHCYHLPMATTLRLPEALMTEAQAYAAGLGLSINGLVAVALREYLDDRRMRRSAPPSDPSGSSGASFGPSEATPAPARPLSTCSGGVHTAPVEPATPRTFNAPKSRSDPCPCGATKPSGHRLKWKECHGRKPVA